jgi:hypothetical protein
VINSLKVGNDLKIVDRGPAQLIISLNNQRSIAYVYNKGNRESLLYDKGNREDLLDYYQNLLTKLAEEAVKKKPDGINGL